MTPEDVFFSLLPERAVSRQDRAVLISAFFKSILGKTPLPLGEISRGFAKAHLAEPRPATVAALLKKDSRVQLASAKVRCLRDGDAYFRKAFPEFSEPEQAIRISSEVKGRLASAPLIDGAYLDDLHKMVELYANLHVLENSMRRLIDLRMRKHLGEDWWETAASAPMKRKHEDRISKERSRKWLPARSEVGPLFSLDWPDLITLMRKYESVFIEDVGSIQFLHRYEDLGLLRNVVAHHGFIDDEDEFGRVRLALRDWCKQITAG